MSVYVAAVMSVMKPLLWLGTSQVRVEGLPGLLELLKQKDRGVVTGQYLPSTCIWYPSRS